MKYSIKTLLVSAMLAGTLTAPCMAEEVEFEALEQSVRELAASSAKVSARRAIGIAKEKAGDAPVVEVELRLDGRRPIFELEFLTAAGELQVVVDALSGKLLGSGLEVRKEEEAADLERVRETLSAAKITLPQAIEFELSAVKGGTVVKAELELEGDELEYEVELLIDGVFKEVMLDADGVLKEVEEEDAQGEAWIFDRAEVGKQPTGWRFGYTGGPDGEASWAVAKDARAPCGPNVLRLEASSADHVFNVGMATGTLYRDVDVRTCLRAESGEVDQGGGVLWRCRDADNYYICRLNPLESNFRVYKVVAGRRKQLQSCTLESRPGTWYVVRARMIGDHIRCYVDGKKLLDVHDGTFEAAGMAGLWTKADASTSFDEVAVQMARASHEEGHGPEEGEAHDGGSVDGHGDHDDDAEH